MLKIGLLGILSSCGGATATTAPLAPQYFDLKGFLDQQRAYLESASPAVTRTVRAGDAAPETQRLARVAWERELHFFYEADLNKPALRGLYAETATALPDGATRRTYRRRPDEHAAIRELTVETGPNGTVRRIEAVQDDHNALFTSERRMMLRCDHGLNYNRLTDYAISGRQKLIFFNPTTYDVRAEVE